jgi:1,4-dihydroxy-6-naphthoate synthase
MTVAHSPDADDIFMYYAIKLGWVGLPGTSFDNIALDIETLNQEALKGTYGITAISFGLYPRIRNDYALLRTAVSFGEGYGPKLVKKKGTKLKRRFKVALSGEHTTNALLFRIAYPEARIVYKNFLDIEAAVLSGEVDAGVLIHESILQFDNTLEVERELWDIWCELAGEGLPLPLGGMALQRALPLTKAIAYEKVLTDAVRVAHLAKPLLSRMLLERGLFRVDAAKLDTYLNMYANEASISMSDTQLDAVNTLFKLGYDHGLYDAALDARDFLIPSQYEAVRFS